MSDHVRHATEIEPSRDRSDKPFVVVGIGASAGGLEALQAIFADIPADSMRNDAAVISEMRKAGATTHLGKDVPIDQIVRHLMKACGREVTEAI